MIIIVATAALIASLVETNVYQSMLAASPSTLFGTGGSTTYEPISSNLSARVCNGEAFHFASMHTIDCTVYVLKAIQRDNYVRLGFAQAAGSLPMDQRLLESPASRIEPAE